MGILADESHFLKSVSRCNIPAFKSCFWYSIWKRTMNEGSLIYKIIIILLTIVAVTRSVAFSFEFVKISSASFSLASDCRYGSVLFSSGLYCMEWFQDLQIHIYCLHLIPIFSSPYPFNIRAFSLLGRSIHFTMDSVAFSVASISVAVKKPVQQNYLCMSFNVYSVLLSAKWVRFWVDLCMGKIEASNFTSRPSNESNIPVCKRALLVSFYDVQTCVATTVAVYTMRWVKSSIFWRLPFMYSRSASSSSNLAWLLFFIFELELERIG
jgi:hypothetical protein